MTIEAQLVLANVLPHAMIAFEKAGPILWWNHYAEQTFLLKPKQIQHIEQVIGENSFRQFLDDPKQKFEMEFKEDKLLAISFVSYIDQTYLLLAHDITHVHHLENMRQDFVANVSHELRTPLTVIHGYLENLMQNKITDTAMCQKIYTQMNQQSLRMERLVEDLLLLSKLETENLLQENKRKIDIAKMIQNICHEARIFSGNQAHQITTNLNEKLSIYGIENELHSAFSNLIINAVNYTPIKGKIDVSWQNEKGCPCFKVVDNGIGIASEDIPRITERFYRVDKARSRARGGTGLGLAIVKHVLLRHNAQLTISSELGKGSTFEVWFH